MDGMNPITRKEIYLAKVAGDQVETPDPITREEMYLKKIAEADGVLVVQLESDGETWSSNKSRAEILTAMSNGHVFFEINGGLAALVKEPDHPEIYGTVILVEPVLGGGGLLISYYAEFAEDGTLSVTESKYSLDSYSDNSAPGGDET